MTGQTQLIVIHGAPLKLNGMINTLKSMGYSTASASSGAEGMQLAKNTKPDIILLDVTLPDASGLEICRQIKSDPQLSHSLVILLDSAKPASDTLAEGSETGADGYITSPISEKEMIARIHDMFRIRSTEQLLKACEERFRLMYEKAPLPYLTLDEFGSILSVNPACERLLGYKRDEILGALFYQMLPSSDADKLRAHFSGMNSPEQPHDLELNVRRKNGAVSRVLFNSFQETDTRCSVHAISCILYDVTDKFKSQADILKAQQLEFTATLAGGIAHDFNNLLMSIMGNISLAQLFLNPEDRANKILEKAEATCNQAKELTQQFIILSKCGYPSKKLSSITKLLKESSVIGVPGPNVDVVLDMPDDVWKIEVDEQQMQYALTHLMTNAVEAMPGGGELHITIRNISVINDKPLPIHPISSGHYLHVMIQDQGQGISSEHLPRIFDPYYTTKELGPKKGMGLGLTTVYSIIHKHDGYIFIKSEVNRGTIVDIYLPAIPVEGSPECF